MWLPTLILISTLAFAHAAQAAESCGFKTKAKLDRAATKAMMRIGRAVPCAECKTSVKVSTPDRGARTQPELFARDEFERILGAPVLSALVAQGPIKIVFSETAGATYPHSMLLNREVVLPVSWIAKRANFPESREMMNFVVAHELAHFAYESTFKGLNPDPSSLRDHLLVDAIGARLAGYTIDEARELLERTIIAGDFVGDIQIRVDCLKKLK